MDIKNKCGISKFKSYEINNQSIYGWNSIMKRWEGLDIKSGNEKLIFRSLWIGFWIVGKDWKSIELNFPSEQFSFYKILQNE